MISPTNHADCASYLRSRWALVTGDRPIEVTISTAQPLVPSMFTESFTCPHGVTFWMEPTGDQQAAWAREEQV